MKNYLGQSLWLVILVLILLTGLSLLPEGMVFCGISFRKMDIFSDIRPAKRTPPTTAVAAPSVLAAKTDSTIASTDLAVDSAQWGRIIEDYTPERRGLGSFFRAVDSIRTHGRTVRIAFFGDSFVEGDILIGDLRDTLQTLWGGTGVGYVPITSEVARFKRTLVHRYEKWETYSITKNHNSGQPFGINGFVYRPLPQAFVHYEGMDLLRHTRRWERFKLFYSADTTAGFVWQNAEMPPQPDTLAASVGRLGVWDWAPPQGTIRAFAFRIDEPDSNLILYGASLESGPGFYLDNFSVRGNTGGRLKKISPTLAKQFDAVLHYDLIVLQLGLNAVTETTDNLPWYQSELDQTFAHIRKCFPEKPILVVSVADRAGKVDGILATLPSVPAIAAMQRDLAKKHGLFFYDLFRGMGGPGAMIAFAEKHRPALANRDYTHLTHEGGKVLGHQFAKLFLEAKKKAVPGM
ncbi:MAG: GDSL-type esterase/lipase family protein [Saprospiraceae bacterium]